MKKDKPENQSLEKIKIELAKCQKEKEEYKTGWQRERADFLNFKKQQENIIQEKKELEKREIILSILPVLDNLEKGLKSKKNQDDFYKGVELIYSQFKEILKKLGVEEIETAIGDDFNPEVHEAISLAESKEKNKIVEVVEKGYWLNKKVLRPAKVKVSG